MNIISALLVSFKWNELTTANNVQHSLFLSAHRKPFLIASALIFLIELISATARGLYLPVEFLGGISWALLVIATITVVVLLWIYGARVLDHLKKVESSGAASGEQKRMKAMRRTTIGMMASGAFLMVAAVSFIVSIILTYTLSETLTVSIVYVVVTHTTLAFASMVQLLSFPTPTAKRNEIGQTRSEAKNTSRSGSTNSA